MTYSLKQSHREHYSQADGIDQKRVFLMLSTISQNTAVTQINREIVALYKAILIHSQWQAECNKKIICGQSLPQKFLNSGTHKYCGFGRWYYGEHCHFITNQEGFLQLENLHKATHEIIEQITGKANNNTPIESDDYNKLIASKKAFTFALVELRDLLISELYSFDFLTGAYNRQAFYFILEKEYARIERSSGCSSIVMVDIDFFKKVNDQYGHLAGDKVLKFFVNYLNMNLRPYDSVGRYGGEEFLICLPDADVEEAQIIMERLRMKLATHPIKIKDKANKQIEISITASFGISSMRKGHSPGKAIELADVAMYEAKSASRNQVQIYSA